MDDSLSVALRRCEDSPRDGDDHSEAHGLRGSRGITVLLVQDRLSLPIGPALHAQDVQIRGERFFAVGPARWTHASRVQVVKDTIWTFEQTQALENFSVYTPVRMTVIRLKSGGLWVHSPVAPTGKSEALELESSQFRNIISAYVSEECIRLVKELGNVEFIVLPTFAYEHKAFVGPFYRRFPNAKVYTIPFQWSFPLNLPPEFYGIGSLTNPAGILASDDETVPWADEIDQKLLCPPPLGMHRSLRSQIHPLTRARARCCRHIGLCEDQRVRVLP